LAVAASGLSFFENPSGSLSSFSFCVLAKKLSRGILTLGRRLPSMRQSAGVEHNSSDLTDCELRYGMLKKGPLLTRIEALLRAFYQQFRKLRNLSEICLY